MKTSMVVGCLLAIGTVTSCARDDDCLFADSVKELKVIRSGKADYRLYRITSGFHDKTSFYQLYAGEPAFDRCGKAASQPVAETGIDLSEGYPSRIVIDNGALELMYSKDGAAPPNFDDIEVVVK